MSFKLPAIRWSSAIYFIWLDTGRNSTADENVQRLHSACEYSCTSTYVLRACEIIKTAFVCLDARSWCHACRDRWPFDVFDALARVCTSLKISAPNTAINKTILLQQQLWTREPQVWREKVLYTLENGKQSAVISKLTANRIRGHHFSKLLNARRYLCVCNILFDAVTSVRSNISNESSR